MNMRWRLGLAVHIHTGAGCGNAIRLYRFKLR